MRTNWDNLDIRAIRLALDESQAQFAARFQVDQSTVHDWETKGLPRRRSSRMLIEAGLATLPAKLPDGLKLPAGLIRAVRNGKKSVAA